MKNIFLLFLASMFFVACSSNETPEQTTPATNATTTAATDKVWHYTCPNNCANSGSDAQGLCPVCNSALSHNQAWHSVPANQNPQQPTQQPVTTNPTSPIIQNPSNPATPTTPTTPTTPATPQDPPQNAAGVWHYVCSTGCSGGAGAQGTCSTCGGALTHNALYHQ